MNCTFKQEDTCTCHTIQTLFGMEHECFFINEESDCQFYKEKITEMQPQEYYDSCKITSHYSTPKNNNPKKTIMRKIYKIGYIVSDIFITINWFYLTYLCIFNKINPMAMKWLVLCASLQYLIYFLLKTIKDIRGKN
jgi:hypothetical protein